MPYTHFTQEDRIEIKHCLRRGEKCSHVARALGKDPTSVSREVRRGRTFVGVRYGHAKPSMLCARRGACTAEGLCGKCAGRRCATCSRRDCTKVCPDYEKEECRRVARWPHVCDGCPDFRTCRLERWSYDVRIAQARAERAAREPREGVDLTGRQLQELDELVTPLMRDRGQSLPQIHMAHADEIPVTLRTPCAYVNKGYVGPGRMYLIDAVRRKPRERRAEPPARAPRRSLAGRAWEDYRALDEEDRDARWEMDTVIGRAGGKCLLTLLHRLTRFQIALLLDSRSGECVRAALRSLAGAGLRAGLVLTDNGPEFFDAEGIEADLGCRLYYCESYSSWQKGAAEKNHGLYRRIVPKGTSLDRATPADCALMMSHVNSRPRGVLGGASPIEAVRPIVGQALLDALGIEDVPRDDVVLAPSLINLKERA